MLDQADINAIADAVAKRTVHRPFFTPQTLAAHLDVSLRLVRKMLADGKIASYTVEGSRRIAPEDVDTYLADRRDLTARRPAA